VSASKTPSKRQLVEDTQSRIELCISMWELPKVYNIATGVTFTQIGIQATF
jgi:hypothetical protein